jgi:hypothetical protein
MQNFRTIRTTTSGRKVTQAEERKKKEREEHAVNSGHLVL